MLSNAFVAALACLAGTAVAAPACRAKPGSGSPQNPFNVQPNGPAVSSLCYTRLGPNAVNGGVPTSWAWSTTACTATTTTTTSVSTITPSPVTTTVTTTTTTTTTPSVVLDSFTTTSTVSVSTTSMSTVTTTTTVTASTSTTSTSVISAPAGFIPIQTALPGASYDGLYGASFANVTKRWGARDATTFSNGWTGNPYGLDHNEPQFVSCAVFTPATNCPTSTVTVKSTTSATTPTITTTKTSTSTVTTVPTLSTTMTSMTTTSLTITATTTSTSTTTTTVVTTSTTSVYAACATNNFADTFNSTLGLSNADSSADFTVNSANATSMYDCCVAALLNSNANNFVYNYGGGCYFATTDTCPDPGNAWTIKTPAKVNYAYGNLGCGFVGATVSS